MSSILDLLSGGPVIGRLNLPLAHSQTFVPNILCAINSAGYAVPVSASASLVCCGRLDSSSVGQFGISTPSGSDGQYSADFTQGTFKLLNAGSPNTVTEANIGDWVYTQDGVTATTSPINAALAGQVLAVNQDNDGLISVQCLYSLNAAHAANEFPGLVRQARGVVTANVSSLSSFTVAGNDGLTYAAGDTVLLVGQTTKSQNGLYSVGAIATGTAPLSRPPDFVTGQLILSGAVFEVSEGTLFANSSWKITTAGGVTVDTTNFDSYPRVVTQQVALTAGTTSITNVPILSASKSTVLASLATKSGTTTTTVGYGTIAAITAGAAGGSPSATVDAYAAGMTLQTGDASTLNVSIINW